MSSGEGLSEAEAVQHANRAGGRAVARGGSALPVVDYSAEALFEFKRRAVWLKAGNANASSSDKSGWLRGNLLRLPVAVGVWLWCRSWRGMATE